MITDNIFGLTDDAVFEKKALEIFRYQAATNPVYAEYLSLIGCDVADVTKLSDVPFLPIEFYKERKIYCGDDPHELLFHSSGTTGMVQSSHYVRSASLYEEAFLDGFHQFYGSPKECNIYALLPSYLEKEGSSLIYMIEKLISMSHDGGFFLYNHDELIERLHDRDTSKKTILWGVSFALLDLADKYELALGDDVVVMETGGMKGRREEITKEAMHEILCRRLGVSKIHSEYGMCECLSQSYSSGDGLFATSSSMRIVIRDLNDPFQLLGSGRRGGVNIIDLANIYSCSFIQTQDMGIVYPDGTFRIEGRILQADIRGCNMLIT